MGWTDSHLWSIETADAAYGPKLPFDDADWIDAKKATLAGVVDGAGGEPLLYTYDFGDGWEHLVTVEMIADGEPGVLYPRLLAATGACPPEDVGGPPGFAAFIEALADPGHERHEEFMEWWGEPFDPAVVDTAAIEVELGRLARRWNRKPPRRKVRAEGGAAA